MLYFSMFNYMRYVTVLQRGASSSTHSSKAQTLKPQLWPEEWIINAQKLTQSLPHCLQNIYDICSNVKCKCSHPRAIGVVLLECNQSNTPLLSFFIAYIFLLMLFALLSCTISILLFNFICFFIYYRVHWFYSSSCCCNTEISPVVSINYPSIYESMKTNTGDDRDGR